MEDRCGNTGASYRQSLQWGSGWSGAGTEVMVCEFQLVELAELDAENPELLLKALVVTPISRQIHFGPDPGPRQNVLLRQYTTSCMVGLSRIA
jgi:hypothetical protein